MNWFKSDKEKTDASIKKAMDKFYENRVDVLMTQVEDLKKEVKKLEWISNNPKKYELGQVVNRYTIFEINYIDYSVVRFHCFKNSPSWEYRGVNPNGLIRTIE